jgi:hypothetical protein
MLQISLETDDHSRGVDPIGFRRSHGIRIELKQEIEGACLQCVFSAEKEKHLV